MPASRKLYEEVADCIYNDVWYSNEMASYHDNFLNKLSDVFERDNSRFDRERFLKACKGRTK